MNNQDASQTGIERISNGDFTGAVSEFEKALEINPKDVKSMLFLAICKLTLIEAQRQPHLRIDNYEYATSKVRDALGLLEDVFKR